MTEGTKVKKCTEIWARKEMIQKYIENSSSMRF